MLIFINANNDIALVYDFPGCIFKRSFAMGLIGYCVSVFFSCLFFFILSKPVLCQPFSARLIITS